ncbi:MAG: sialidase family protein [Planctomycetota bacterium]|jgi:predicted neuraminidase
MVRSKYFLFVTGAVIMAAVISANAADLSKQPGIEKMEFVFDKAPFKQCHASTIAETRRRGLVAAWFGGTEESHSDVGIWLSAREGEKWSEPTEVANGVQHNKKRYPCWNPVLYQPKRGPLFLFYKVGPSPSSWWGMLKVVNPRGRAGQRAWRLPEDILGPVRNKPIDLPDGTLLCGSSTEHAGWRVHFELSKNMGQTWELVGPVNDGKEFGAIQPTLLIYADGRIQALCRSQQGRITETWSSDGAKTWSKMAATSLPNPNSGIDGVTLVDGRQLLVYNHTTDGRSPLNVAVSQDGKDWKAALVLENEPGEYSYPAVIQTSDGKVHTVYTWKRRKIKHVVIDPAKLVVKDIVDGQWPK